MARYTVARNHDGAAGWPYDFGDPPPVVYHESDDHLAALAAISGRGSIVIDHTDGLYYDIHTRAWAPVPVAALERYTRRPSQSCPHDWHYNGEINGRPYYGCQTCGAERTE